MRKLVCLLALSVLAAPLARADGSIVINARAGVERPWGDFYKARPMSDAIDWAFPLQGDLQFRLTRALQVGAYARYAPTVLATRVRNLCRGVNVSCSDTDIGFGGVVEYRFSDRLEGGGWVGASFGYEMLKAELGSVAAGAKETDTYKGFEGGVQAGIDFELGGLTIGPFVEVRGGRLTSVTQDVGSTSTDKSLTGQRLHGWAGLGIRVSLVL
jgi:hypothetical protein